MLDWFDTGWVGVGLGKFTVPGLGKFLENGNWNGVLGYCTGPGLIQTCFASGKVLHSFNHAIAVTVKNGWFTHSA